MVKLFQGERRPPRKGFDTREQFVIEAQRPGYAYDPCLVGWLHPLRSKAITKVIDELVQLWGPLVYNMLLDQMEDSIRAKGWMPPVSEAVAPVADASDPTPLPSVPPSSPPEASE